MSADLVGQGYVLDHNRNVHNLLTQASIYDLELEGAKLDIDLTGAFRTCEWERSILAPTSITFNVADATGQLREKHLPKDANHQAIVSLNGYEFGVVKVSTGMHDVTLVNEDAPAAYARRYNSYRKTTGKQGRQRFIFSMFREILEDDVPFYCPLIDEGQLPVRSKASGKVPAHRALTGSDKLTVKGARADGEQLRVMSEVLRAAAKYSKNNRDAMVCCIMCIIVENEARNRRIDVDHDSVGAFQQRKSTGWKGDLTDIDRQVKNFLLDAPTTPLMVSLRHKGKRTLGQLVQETQRSGYPTRYDERKSEAREIVAAYMKNAPADDQPTVFARGQQGTKENSYIAGLRLADEVNWRLYSDFGLVVLADETVLTDSAPAPEIDVRKAGFDLVRSDIDWGKPLSTAEVAIADWDFPIAPGVPVPLAGGGMANGTWLIESINGALGVHGRTVKLRRPGPPKPEPSADRNTPKKAKASGGNAPAKILKLLEVCQTMSDNTPGYLFGGGHGLPLAQINSHIRLDCSSSTSYALYKAGLFGKRTHPMGSSGFAGWGQSGSGRWLTVYYNAGHVFIMFVVDGVRYRFDTGGPGGGHGPKLHKGSAAARDVSGFQTRRYPDL